MIVFLNFAPINFMGGAERWMYETAKYIDSREETTLVSVDASIADVYGKLILKRKFVNRSGQKRIANNISLSLGHFIPHTRKWRDVRRRMSDARLIYFKYEILEFLILIYFGGFSAIRKSIAGVHSPFHYDNPESTMGKLHNELYGSGLSIWAMGKLHKMHVMNKKDENVMKNTFGLKNIVYIPNSVPVPPKLSTATWNNENKLKILFVGELSDRKGIDYLISTIRNATEDYHFTVAGDGPYQSQLKALSRELSNCDYVGFVDKQTLDKLYKSHDILFLPSRAETMSLSVLEALSYGLLIVDSPETNLGLDKTIEYSPEDKNNTYMELFDRIRLLKEKRRLNRQDVVHYFNENFSPQVVMPQLTKNVFGL